MIFLGSTGPALPLGELDGCLERSAKGDSKKRPRKYLFDSESYERPPIIDNEHES